jgi:cyclase
LEAGADKVAVNTAAVGRPRLVKELAERFGSQCTVVSVDAGRYPAGWHVIVGSGRIWTGIEVVDWCREAVALAAERSSSPAGTGTGPRRDMTLV